MYVLRDAYIYIILYNNKKKPLGNIKEYNNKTKYNVYAVAKGIDYVFGEDRVNPGGFYVGPLPADLSSPAALHAPNDRTTDGIKLVSFTL